MLSGAGLLSVLSPLREGLGSVPEAQAEALSAALGWGPAGGSGDRFLIGAATLSLLAAESSRTPLLIAVDDVQWVDVGVRGRVGLRCPPARPRPGRGRDDTSGRHAAPGPAGRLRGHHGRRPRAGSRASSARARLLGRCRGQAGVRDRRQPARPAGMSAGAQPGATSGGRAPASGPSCSRALARRVRRRARRAVTGRVAGRRAVRGEQRPGGGAGARGAGRRRPRLRRPAWPSRARSWSPRAES